MTTMKTRTQKGVVIVEHCLRLSLLRGEGVALMHQRGNIVIPLSMASLEMEEFGVRVPILQVAVPRLLLRDGPGQR